MLLLQLHYIKCVMGLWIHMTAALFSWDAQTVLTQYLNKLYDILQQTKNLKQWTKAFKHV